MKGWAKYVKDKGEYVGIDSFGKKLFTNKYMITLM